MFPAQPQQKHKKTGKNNELNTIIFDMTRQHQAGMTLYF